MNVKDIVLEYLQAHGYDGLYTPGGCACIKSNLMPCGEFNTDCEAGYLCDGDDPECDFYIGPKESPDR